MYSNTYFGEWKDAHASCIKSAASPCAITCAVLVWGASTARWNLAYRDVREVPFGVHNVHDRWKCIHSASMNALRMLVWDVAQEERSIFWEVIISVILRKKVYVRVLFRTVSEIELLHCTVVSIWCPILSSLPPYCATV
jgi:hypothetical protein